MYLFPYYDSLLNAHSRCRRSVITNHYSTLLNISKINSSLDFSFFLNPFDIEHLVVVDRLFIHCLRSLCPRPFIRLPEEGKTECSHEEVLEIVEHLSRPLFSLVDCVFRFCQVVYQQYTIVPFFMFSDH